MNYLKMNKTLNCRVVLIIYSFKKNLRGFRFANVNHFFKKDNYSIDLLSLQKLLKTSRNEKNCFCFIKRSAYGWSKCTEL